jgi:excisionase family DNA binding protein
MSKHRPKWQRVKIHRSYTVEEAANVLEIDKGTIRRWVKEKGLPILGDRKPALIHGTSLKAFGNDRSKPKVKCKPDEFYYFRCKTPRSPAGNMADYIARTPKSGNMKAICEHCDTIMNKHVSNTSLPALGKVLDLSIHLAPEHLVESLKPCSNDN